MLPNYNEAAALFRAYGLDVSCETYGSLEEYAEFLVDYNTRVNLTSITQGEEILHKHFLDSLLLEAHCSEQLRGELLDIGSGAGFPGVPLALLRPELSVTLLDSLNKRIVFLEALRDRLGLSYTAVHGRAEEYVRTHRECFDCVTARAVAALPRLAEYSLPYVKPGGFWLAMKGPNEPVRPALQAIRLLGGELTDTVEYSLPGGEKRVIYVVQKISHTPTKYPRSSGQLKQKPL